MKTVQKKILLILNTETMKILFLLFASVFASPANDRRCEVTCSGVTDNYTQYAHNLLALEG